MDEEHTCFIMISTRPEQSYSCPSRKRCSRDLRPWKSGSLGSKNSRSTLTSLPAADWLSDELPASESDWLGSVLSSSEELLWSSSAWATFRFLFWAIVGKRTQGALTDLYTSVPRRVSGHPMKIQARWCLQHFRKNVTTYFKLLPQAQVRLPQYVGSEVSPMNKQRKTGAHGHAQEYPFLENFVKKVYSLFLSISPPIMSHLSLKFRVPGAGGAQNDGPCQNIGLPKPCLARASALMLEPICQED